MNTQELIENAVLDAMGLLEPEEREAFDDAFSSAAPAVQAQVRREQTRLALSEDLLPDVEPPAGLRAMVVEMVRKAMASASEKGAGKGGARRHRHAKTAVMALVPARQVSPLWRMASVGCAAAALTFAAVFLDLRREFGTLAAAVENDRLLSDMQGAVGSPFVVGLLTDPDTESRDFVATNPATRGQARLWSNPVWGEGDQVMIAMSNLPANPAGMNQPLAIYACENGKLVGQPLHEFANRAGFQMVRFEIPQAGKNLRLAIAQVDDHGVYQPLFLTPPPALAWLEIDFFPEDEIA